MRGQAYTLEAFVASILVISALVFALQSTAVTPLSSSTSSQHIENQERSAASGALVAAAEAEALKPAISAIDGDEGEFFGSGTDGAYVNNYPPGEFGDILNRTFGGRGLAVDITIRYRNEDNEQEYYQFVERGAPSDHAVSASQPVTIYENDSLYEVINGSELNETERTWDDVDNSFEIPNFDDIGDYEESDVYHIVVVEVTVWRM